MDIFRHGIANPENTEQLVIVLQRKGIRIDIFDYKTDSLKAAHAVRDSKDDLTMIYIGPMGDFLRTDLGKPDGECWVGWAETLDGYVEIYENSTLDAIQAIPQGVLECLLYRDRV